MTDSSTPHQHSIELDATDLRAINRLIGSHFAQVTLYNFSPSTRFHQSLKSAADLSVRSSRGVVIVKESAQ